MRQKKCGSTSCVVKAIRPEEVQGISSNTNNTSVSEVMLRQKDICLFHVKGFSHTHAGITREAGVRNKATDGKRGTGLLG